MGLQKIASRLFAGTTRFARDETGNALFLMAFAVPMVLGGGGLAVDFAQIYLWKREAQFAIDQAALAAGYAQIKVNPAFDWQRNADLSFDSNIAVTRDFISRPTYRLANWSTGVGNSVIASASLSKRLPFADFFLRRPIAINVSAQVSFSQAFEFTSCLIATDEDEDGAVVIGGNTTFTAGCGIAALSDSDQAIIIEGNPEVEAGWVLSKGGIDDWFDYHTDDEVHEYIDGLKDPFEDLVPPDNPTPQTYACSTSKGGQAKKIATLGPGTYKSIVTACNTVMASGIYVIDGGSFEVRSQDVVTGAGIMIVLKNGARIHINGGAEVNMTAMSVEELMRAGVEFEAAQKLEGMLVFERRDSESRRANILNGNAKTTLNGSIYLPNSSLEFSGTATMTTMCLMLVANTIKLTGNTMMSSFCPEGLEHDDVVASEVGRVMLVS